MKPLTRLILALAVCSGAVSCALPSRFASPSKKPLALQEGMRYEVRKALPATAAFDPGKVKGYFVIVAPTQHPPLMAAANGSRRTVRTTAYCHDESDHIAYGNRNAIGTPLRFGSIRSAAADWSRYPLGTLFRISSQPGVVYQVDDYGSALVGTDTIDLYKPTQQQMNDWGVRHVDIEVIKWGSYQNSMHIIKDRTRYPHVRKMFDNLQQRLYQTGLTRGSASPLVML